MRQRYSRHSRPLPTFSIPLYTQIQVDRSSDVPLYRQISQGLRDVIVSGELTEGSRLPTERALAEKLGVNRTTIMNAYNELESEGLIEGHVGRGTLVKRTYVGKDDDFFEHEMPSWLLGLSAGEDAMLGPDARVLSEISSMSERREIISLAQGTPALEMLPIEFIQQLLREQVVDFRRHALGYCPVEGAIELRRSIAERMRRRGVAADISNILILSGSTQGVGLIGRFLLQPGDEVVVEVPTYLGALQTFRALGAKVIGVPTDSEGMRVDLLEAILARRQPRLIYTLPTFQNPTGIVMSAERRRRLLLLARRYQIPILEDDAYSELYFDGNETEPLKAQDRHGNVLYLSTYSKTLAPGLRVAWMVVPEPVVERLSLHKQIFDLNTNALGQWIIAEILRRRYMDEHLATTRSYYQRKRDLMLQAIAACWPANVRVSSPGGGFHLWCRLPAEIRARTLLREAVQERVAFVIGEPFHADGGGQHALRLSFAFPEEEDIVEGIQRIGHAMQRILQQHKLQNDQNAAHTEHLPMV